MPDTKYLTALFYPILIKSLYAGINCHHPHFAGKKTEAQMEIQQLLEVTKLLRGGVRIRFVSLLGQETMSSPTAPSTAVSKEKT